MNDGKLINLTPHAVVIITDRGQTEIPASGMVARVKQSPRKQIGTIGNTSPDCFPIPVFPSPKFGDIEWPEFDRSKYNGAIVSLLVGQAVENQHPKDRPPFLVLSPDTSPDNVVRDDDGNIEGVGALNVHTWGTSSSVYNEPENA